MGIVQLFMEIAFIGVVAWLITRYIPMPPPIAKVIIVIAVIFCVVIALAALGVGFHDALVPKIVH